MYGVSEWPVIADTKQFIYMKINLFEMKKWIYWKVI
jgi:hypothetical protein